MLLPETKAKILLKHLHLHLSQEDGDEEQA
ncbi:hypothetical protein Tco_0495217, partial [Tanacetum coccineum]